jgi:predicted dehydrogenase/aryl-alcohol dehydrogenase-like predicted oxidoreductase
MDKKLRWGVIGTGRIARVFAKGVSGSTTGRLVAAADSDKARADTFAEEVGIERTYGKGDSLLADPQVDAVYVSTPHPFHAEWTIKAARAGKHVLCEKPLGLNHAEAMAAVEAARANGVFLMEGFMYRCHPQTEKLIELIRGGAIGEVRAVEATFSFDFPFEGSHRLLSQELGGGGILDVGCYCTSMARLIAGVASGRDFEEPTEVKGTAHIGEASRVDEYAVASLEFPSGIVAQLATGVQLNMENAVRIFGSKGWVLLPQPWLPGEDGRSSKIVVHREGQDRAEEIVVESEFGLYSLEADTVAAHLEDGQAPPPAMTWDDSLGNMKTLDLWRQSIGLVYDSERPEAPVRSLTTCPLRVRDDSTMKHGRVAGVEKPVARLVMGVDNQTTMPHAAVMFDDYFERGGNCFDTAYIYTGGLSERLLGRWIEARDVREQVVIVAKGAHTPFNRPEHLRAQLEQSLQRLQTDYVDIHLAHRDNTDIPVAEWVDGFNKLLQDGMIRAYGVSNWQIERVEAANAYASEKGLVGIAALSNNFSLARMVAPVWPGCVAASDPKSRSWLTGTQTPLLAWSSQARGFFAGRARPDDRSDEELVRCWYSEDNFRRLARTKEMAEERGVLPINIALGYVLAQPFPTFALIGPRSLSETRIAAQGLDVELTPEEVRRLNLED